MISITQSRIRLKCYTAAFGNLTDRTANSGNITDIIDIIDIIDITDTSYKTYPLYQSYPLSQILISDSLYLSYELRGVRVAVSSRDGRAVHGSWLH